MNNQRHDWLLFMAGALGIAMLAWLLVAQGPLRLAENWVSDLRVALMTPRQLPPDDLVLLTITEDTLRLFPYRSPVNRTFLAQAITLLNQKGVRAIGLDILFDRPTEPAAAEQLDRAVMAPRLDPRSPLKPLGEAREGKFRRGRGGRWRRAGAQQQRAADGRGRAAAEEKEKASVHGVLLRPARRRGGARAPRRGRWRTARAAAARPRC